MLSAEPVCSCAFLAKCASCTWDRGCSAHPVFPAPSLEGRVRPLAFGGPMTLQNSDKRCRENAYVRHYPRRRMIQYSEELVIEPRTRGVLDTPPSRSMTAVVGGASSSTSLRAKRSNPALPCCRGLLRRGACHRARIRATRWLLAMTRSDAGAGSPANMAESGIFAAAR